MANFWSRVPLLFFYLFDFVFLSNCQTNIPSCANTSTSKAGGWSNSILTANSGWIFSTKNVTLPYEVTIVVQTVVLFKTWKIAGDHPTDFFSWNDYDFLSTNPEINFLFQIHNFDSCFKFNLFCCLLCLFINVNACVNGWMATVWPDGLLSTSPLRHQISPLLIPTSIFSSCNFEKWPPWLFYYIFMWHFLENFTFCKKSSLKIKKNNL